MTTQNKAADTAAEKAIRAWKYQEFPEDFGRHYQDSDGNRVFVTICLKENFPAGGRTYTVEVRPEKRSEELTQRFKLSLVNGVVARL